MGVYEPAEDSFLVQKYVRELALGRVLDLGTGSGIQALTAMTNPNAHFILAVDQDETAVRALQEKINQEHLRKLQVRQSDLFSEVPGKFNLIIFNPPYLPQDKGLEDKAIYGGKKGWELSEQFFRQASAHLYPDGKILFLFSSLTNITKIQEILHRHLFTFREVEQQKVAFETLHLYLIEKTTILQELEQKGLEHLRYFTQGKRGEIFRGMVDRSKFIKSHLAQKSDIIPVAVKIPRTGSAAPNTIENEAQYLQRANAVYLGPQYQFHTPRYLVMTFIEGDYILDWIQNNKKPAIRKVLIALLQQCHTVDTLHFSKEEMHHPLKHIIVTKHNHPILVDFERCTETSKPKNVTQFVEFICRIEPELHHKGFTFLVPDLRTLAQKYKETLDKTILTEIIIQLQ